MNILAISSRYIKEVHLIVLLAAEVTNLSGHG